MDAETRDRLAREFLVTEAIGLSLIANQQEGSAARGRFRQKHGLNGDTTMMIVMRAWALAPKAYLVDALVRAARKNPSWLSASDFTEGALARSWSREVSVIREALEATRRIVEGEVTEVTEVEVARPDADWTPTDMETPL